MNSFKDIAYQILKEAGKPLHYREITSLAQKKGLLQTEGKTPWATMNAQLSMDIVTKGECSNFIRSRPGYYFINQKVNFNKKNQSYILVPDLQGRIASHLLWIKKGVYYIEDRKCNFDVEISVDMLLDYERIDTETFALWSGDSDFADPIEKLLKAGKKVVLFATAGRIARELNELRATGLGIFDIFDLKEFICWPRESVYKSTKDPLTGALQL